MATSSEHSLKTKHIFICISASLICSFLVIFVFYAFTVDTIFYKNDSCLDVRYAQLCYFGKNDIWSDSSYLQTITGFYNAIITVLIGIVAIVAAVGAYTVKASIRAQTEQELPQVVSNHFNHMDGQAQVRRVVEDRMEAKLNEIRDALNRLPIPESGELIQMLTSIERRLESMEEIVNVVEED